MNLYINLKLEKKKLIIYLNKIFIKFGKLKYFLYLYSMKKIHHFIIILIILTSHLGKTQTYQERELQFATVNILTSGIIGGIGSLIHSKKSDRNLKTFFIGFTKGGLGGGLNFTSKIMLNKVGSEKDWYIIHSSKLINACGNSLINSASLNYKLSFIYQFGFIRFELGNKSNIRIMPIALAGFGFSFLGHQKFDLSKTLIYGTPYFKDLTKGQDDCGITYVNSIHIKENFKLIKEISNGNVSITSFNDQRTITHEIIHTYQYQEFLPINNFYLKQESKLFHYDLPVFILPYLISEGINKSKKGSYYGNFYENEAETLSEGKFIK